jgi:hypothetical protein
MLCARIDRIWLQFRRFKLWHFCLSAWPSLADLRIQWHLSYTNCSYRYYHICCTRNRVKHISLTWWQLFKSSRRYRLGYFLRRLQLGSLRTNKSCKYVNVIYYFSARLEIATDWIWKILWYCWISAQRLHLTTLYSLHKLHR